MSVIYYPYKCTYVNVYKQAVTCSQLANYGSCAAVSLLIRKHAVVFILTKDATDMHESTKL